MIWKIVPNVDNMKKTHIYSLSDPITKQIRYIGKADNLRKRFNTHICDKSRTHKTNWINLLKSQNLSPIIESLDEVNLSDWEFWEKHYISLFKSWGFKLVNGTDGGDGSNGRPMSQENKEKLRQYRLAHPLSKESCEKISLANKGRKHTKESILKISESRIGSKNPNFGKKQSVEIIAKQVEARKETLKRKKLAIINKTN